jgi:hypothetical protein
MRVPRRLRGWPKGGREASSPFFEKKDPKNFIPLHQMARIEYAPIDKSFLFLFFKKETLVFFLPRAASTNRTGYAFRMSATGV